MTRRTDTESSSERGAILVHVAVALIGLLAFSAFAVDYGVFWASRRAAQNSADAAALAGAGAFASDPSADMTDTGVAKQTALKIAQVNKIWGAAPSVDVTGDITFPTCPDGAGTCIQVDVYRTNARGNALPVFFASFVGLVDQDIRASATAEVSSANASDCLKPWAVIDKWAEHWPSTAEWTTDSTFDKYQTKGGAKGEIDPAITTPDVYIPPTESDFGTGFHPYDAEGDYTSDYGLEMELKVGGKDDFDFASGWFSALALEDSKGGKDYKTNIKGCVGITYKVGDELPVNTEPGEMVGPTRQGVESDADSLINQDPGAHWDPSLNDGRGGVAGSAFATSPRIVAIPLVNPDIMAEVNKGGRTTVPIANIAGFFVERFDDKGVVGRLVTMKGLKVAGVGGTASPGSFLHTITLVR
jgi:Flp pilus assembly protein TadG